MFLWILSQRLKKCVKKPYSLIIGTNSENEKNGAFLYTRD